MGSVCIFALHLWLLSLFILQNAPNMPPHQRMTHIKYRFNKAATARKCIFNNHLRVLQYTIHFWLVNKKP